MGRSGVRESNGIAVAPRLPLLTVGFYQGAPPLPDAHRIAYRQPAVSSWVDAPLHLHRQPPLPIPHPGLSLSSSTRSQLPATAFPTYTQTSVQLGSEKTYACIRDTCLTLFFHFPPPLTRLHHLPLQHSRAFEACALATETRLVHTYLQPLPPRPPSRASGLVLTAASLARLVVPSTSHLHTSSRLTQTSCHTPPTRATKTPLSQPNNTARLPLPFPQSISSPQSLPHSTSLTRASLHGEAFVFIAKHQSY